MKVISIKPCINKKNGQINFSLPKKMLPKKDKEKITDLKGIKINVNKFLPIYIHI